MNFVSVDDYLNQIATEHVNVRPNLVFVRGIPQNPKFDAAAMDDVIDNFVTRDGDVFLASYPRSGTAWTQQIIHCLLRMGKGNNLHRGAEAVPWLEACASSPDEVGKGEAPGFTMRAINANPFERHFMSHANVRDLPRGKASHLLVIYVARNPKDVMVSMFHHMRNKAAFEYADGDFESFFKLFLTGQVECGSWFDHVTGWYKKCQQHPGSHIFLKYEDICDNPGAIAKQIAHLMLIPVTENLLDIIVAQTSINEMKRIFGSYGGLNHIGKGGYGGWREYFTPEMSEIFDKVYKHKMSGSPGLTFNFGPYLT